MTIGKGWKKSYKDKDTGEDKAFISANIDLIPLEALKTGKLNITVFQAKEKRTDASPDYDISWSPARAGGPVANDDMPPGF